MKQLPCWWPIDGVCACPKGATCTSPGKHPLTKHGVSDATDDPDQLAAWREQWPQANWAIAAGDGVFIVDLDRKPGKDGLAAFKALGAVPHTRTVRTGSRGLHLYFKGEAPNTAGRLGPGIDTRGAGGYVMAPGSVHASGGIYEVAADEPIAEAPAWLLSALKRPVPASPSVQTHSDPVVEGARDALEAHGPAIEGSGGDMHTWRAAALVANDWDLADDRGWALFQEWNQTCDPPWDLHELRAKFDGGSRYATRERGGARPFNALAAASAALGRSDGSEPTTLVIIKELRAIAERAADPDISGSIERLASGYGIKVKALALPDVRRPPPETKPGEIMVGPKLHTMADEALRTMAPHVYQRGGVLCEPIKPDGKGIQILELTATRIRDLMSEHAKWVRDDGEGGIKTVAPPMDVAAILADRRKHAVRVLEAVTTVPIMLKDGSILSAEGYNETAKVYLDPSVTVDVPDRPTRDDAREAVALLKELVCDFHFYEPADRSAWLAGLLSPLVKAATDNAPSPLICVSASNAGAGKTLLTDVIARIITGRPAEMRGYNPRDPVEWGKRLTAFVKSGCPVAVLDNVDGRVGDEALDRLITSSAWNDRILGGSEAVTLPNVSTWFTTGKNTEPFQDTVRRVLMVRIIVDSEKPQERTDFKIRSLEAHALSHRADYLTAALTVLRAFHAAGRPAQGLQEWGSFAVWSSLIREALVWAGEPDPYLTQARLSRDALEEDETAHDFWIGVVSACSSGGAAELSKRANEAGAMSTLGLRDSITPHGLRSLLGRFIDKPRKGQRIRREGGRYWVEAV